MNTVDLLRSALMLFRSDPIHHRLTMRLLVALCCVGMLACSGNSTTDLDSPMMEGIEDRPADLSGTVVSQSGWEPRRIRLTTAENPEESDGLTDHVIVRVSKGTPLPRGIRKGTRIKVWHGMAVYNSMPPQVSALKIEISD